MDKMNGKGRIGGGGTVEGMAGRRRSSHGQAGGREAKNKRLSILLLTKYMCYNILNYMRTSIHCVPIIAGLMPGHVVYYFEGLLNKKLGFLRNPGLLIRIIQRQAFSKIEKVADVSQALVQSSSRDAERNSET
jgi:hypothetical protein